jgi:hypothetical protein
VANSKKLNDFGPAVTKQSTARQRAAMPFVHLERALWDLRDRDGNKIDPDAPERGNALRTLGAHGRLRPEMERLLSEPGTLAAAARLLGTALHPGPGSAHLRCRRPGCRRRPAAGLRQRHPGHLTPPGRADEAGRSERRLEEHATELSNPDLVARRTASRICEELNSPNPDLRRIKENLTDLGLAVGTVASIITTL